MKSDHSRHAFFLIIVMSLITITLSSTAIARRDIPDDNLAHPVLIYSDNGVTGSGFYLTADKSIYLVTARHVLFNETISKLTSTLESQDYNIPNKFKFRLSYRPDKMTLSFEGVMSHDDMDLLKRDRTKSKQFKKAIDDLYEKSQHLNLRFNTATLLSYSAQEQVVGSEDDTNELILQLGDLMKKGLIRYHLSADVAIIKIGVTKTLEKDPAHFTIAFSPSIIAKGPGLAAIPKDHTKLFKDVLIGNRIYLFGYPTSISSEDPELDIKSPLLRGGIVAGKNKTLNNIILDSPVYYGNSGGLVLEVEDTSVGVTNYRGIGIISQLVPFLPNSTQFQNSGYSVAVPMDFVYELISD